MRKNIKEKKRKDNKGKNMTYSQAASVTTPLTSMENTKECFNKDNNYNMHHSRTNAKYHKTWII